MVDTNPSKSAPLGGAHRTLTIYVAFVIDVFARKIVGWRVSRSMTTEFVLDALNQAICQRCPMEADNLIHHSDRGSQYLAIRYAERLVEAGIDPSVGSVGDSYDNALAECIIGLFKTEVINHIGPWRSMGQLEWATLKWVDWFNNERLLEPIGYITPAEAEEAYCREHSELTGLCTIWFDRFCCGFWPCGEVVGRGAAVHLSTGRRSVASKRVTRPRGFGCRSVDHRRGIAPDIAVHGRRPLCRRGIRGRGPWP